MKTHAAGHTWERFFLVGCVKWEDQLKLGSLEVRRPHVKFGPHLLLVAHVKTRKKEVRAFCLLAPLSRASLSIPSHKPICTETWQLSRTSLAPGISSLVDRENTGSLAFPAVDVLLDDMEHSL